MSINRGIDKEDIHIFNGILLSHEKEWYDFICSNINEPRDCHTEWSKWDQEGEISYDISYMWIIKRNYTNELAK